MSQRIMDIFSPKDKNKNIQLALLIINQTGKTQCPSAFIKKRKRKKFYLCYVKKCLSCEKGKRIPQ
jgi:hypothetical protein